MSQPEYKPFIFALYPEDDQKINEVAVRMAAVIGNRRPNRSDALRRILAEFDIEAWERRNQRPIDTPAQAA